MLGRALRERFSARWLRIHSLPESKRYPDNEDEYREILRRQNDILSDLIEVGSECSLVFGYYGEEERLPPGARASLRALDPVVLDTDLMVAAFSWTRGALDPILRAVADDELETPLVIRGPRVFAPYDGGMDLIVESPQKRDELKERYSAWRSTHPEGL